MSEFIVHVVDDDAQILKALSRVLVFAGYGVRTFSNAESFLEQHDPAVPGCALVDLGLPGKSGLEIQQELQGCGMPVVFLSGRGSINITVRAMKAGALDFLEKPVEPEILLSAVGEARQIDEARRRLQHDHREVEERLLRLTPRERQVLDHVVAGLLNKQIAGELGTAEKTVKVHRGRMMQKMGVRTVADLVRVVERIRPEQA
jgi:FixJ family two-component response regulator